jgi:GTPase SAR1 family protein
VDRREADAHAKISAKMSADSKALKNSMSVLILGPGGSGKSTILKQMEKIHNGEVGDEDMASSVRKIREHIVGDFIDVCAHYIAMRSGKTSAEDDAKSSFEGDDPKLVAIIEEWAAMKRSLTELPELKPEIAALITAVWALPTFKSALTERSKSHIMDNTPWLFERIDEFADPAFAGSFEAYVRLRDRTTGGITRTFTIDLRGSEWLFLVTDVGGQKAERKKWLAFFSDVNAVLYVIAMSAFDQVTFEDHTMSVLDDSFELFENTVVSAHFAKTDWVVFLNKSDVFDEKVANGVDFRVYEADFPAEHAADRGAVSEYFKKRFTKSWEKTNKVILDGIKKRHPELLETSLPRAIYFHVTMATDTEQIAKCVADIQLGIVSRAMADIQLV